MSATKSTVNPGVSPIAPLQNVRLFLELIEKMQTRAPHLPGLGVFYSFSGYGKTQSAINGANRWNAAYVECGQSWNSNTLLDAILHELTGAVPRGTIAKKMVAIIEVLAADTRPLIIDEADFLVKRSVIDLVREMSDRSGAAVILIGEEQLPYKLQPFERAHNRVLHWQPAEPCNIEDAKALARLYVPQLDVEPALLKQVVDITHGVTRRVVSNLEAIREFSAERNLKAVGLKEWGNTTIYTGMPQPRVRKAGRAA